MKSILDPTFSYVPSSRTDVRKTFARIRNELRTSEQARRVTGEARNGIDIPAKPQRSPASAR